MRGFLNLSLTLCVLCPKFREARTSAHNQVRDVIISLLTFTLQSEWTLFEETRVANTRLALCSSSRTDNDIDRLGRRQPDWILVSNEHKRIAIVDLCRPSDIHQTQLLAAAIRKQQAYQPLSTSGGRPELLYRVRVGCGCLPVDSGNSGDDRLFPRRIPSEVS